MGKSDHRKDTAQPEEPPPSYHEATSGRLIDKEENRHDGKNSSVSTTPSNSPILGIPNGWLRQVDPVSGQEVFVNTRSNPPVRLSSHPLLDREYLLQLSDEQRQQLKAEVSQASTPAQNSSSKVKEPSQASVIRDPLIINIRIFDPWIGCKQTILELQREPPYPILWRLLYTSEHEAEMHRIYRPTAKTPKQQRDIAKVKFPEMPWPGSGPVITFEPHEKEIERRGRRHATSTQRLMACTGVITTIFTFDSPLLSNATCAWEVIPTEKRSSKSQAKSDCPHHAELDEKSRLRAAVEQEPAGEGSKTPKSQRKQKQQQWTPFAKQQLREVSTGKVLATYLRASPWAENTGKLEILPSGVEQDSGGLDGEAIEGIIISCAAMVGMQDVMGLMGTLIEAGFDAAAGKLKAFS